MLLVFGLASAAGVVLAGRFGERTDRAIVVTAIATGIGVAALGFVAVHPALGLARARALGGGIPPAPATRADDDPANWPGRSTVRSPVR